MTESKYIRVSQKAGSEKFNEIGQKVQKGLLRKSYSAIDNGIIYHYYLKLK